VLSRISYIASGMPLLEDEQNFKLGACVGAHKTPISGHHLVPNRPLQVGGGPIHPYKYPLTVKVEIPHSTCSSPLVKVPV
jgi:hypothetical protein